MTAIAIGDSSHLTRSDSEARRQQILARRICAVSAAALGVAAVTFLLTTFNYRYWQLYLITFVFSIGFIIATVAAIVRRSQHQEIKALWVGPAVAAPLIILAATVQGLTLLIALIIFLFGTILSTGALEGRTRDFGISMSFFSALVVTLVGTFSPVRQVRIPSLEILVPSILSILLMTYIVLLTMDYVTANLRIKLLSGSLAVAILPLILLSLIDSRVIQNSLQNQTNQALGLAADQTVVAIESFLTSNLDLMQREAGLTVFLDYLTLTPEQRKGSAQEQAVELTLRSLSTQQHTYVRSLGLLNTRGEVIFDINPLQVGMNDLSSLYFTDTVSTGLPRISPVVFSDKNDDASIYFSSPIRDARQQLIGILRIQYDAMVMQTLLEENINLIGARSYPILLDNNYLRLADTLTPNNIYRLLAPLPSTTMTVLNMDKRLPVVPIYKMDTGDQKLVPILKNYLTNSFFSAEFHKDIGGHIETGAVKRLSSQPWFLLFVQEQTSLASLLQSQGKLSTLISTIIAGLVGLFASMMSSVFSKPIIRLHTTAEKIIAGDFDAKAQVESGDEIGNLASAFNNMTAQLKTFINELEDRVRERTHELARQNATLTFRSRQLQTVSDVARGIISTREFEALLTQVTTLVSERFNFYHVGVFLNDMQNEYAVLRAANSEGGRQMLARQHRLKIGEVGIVGHVTALGEPRIATDVGQDAVFFNNPDLPLTRSEMALPLKANERIIGALDVQSTESNAFTHEDIELFSTLADQISIAIVNNQLFNETVKALEESQRIHRQYLRQEWTSEVTDRQTRSFMYSPKGTIAQQEIELPEIKEALKIGKPVAQAAIGKDQPAVLAVPIKLRGETIGVIHLKDAGIADRQWNDDEITSISAVADQVGLALENARLLEKTLRRAERDRRALEITGKIRSANDPQSMVDTALQELQKALNASRAVIVLKDTASGGQVGSTSLEAVDELLNRANPA